MGFFKQQDTEHPASGTDPAVVSLSASLKACLDKVKQRAPWREAIARKQLRLLAATVEGGCAAVQSVIEWYVSHLATDEDPFIVTSARQFRERFDMLQRRMRKSASGRSAPSKPVEPAVLEILEKIGPWPVADGLPQAVQSSLDNYRAFRSALTKLHKELAPLNVPDKRGVSRSSKGGDLALFIADLEWDFLRDCPRFVMNWMACARDEAAGWEGWSGNMSHYTFSRDSNRLRKMGERLSMDRSGDVKLWHYLMEKLS